MVKKVCFISFLSVLFFACNLTDRGNDEIVISGTVMNSSVEDLPIEGLNIVVKVSGGPWNYPVVAETKTDINGVFIIKHDLQEHNIAHVYINDEPYNPLYSTDNFGINKGDVIEKTFALYQNTGLRVRASTNALQNDDHFCVNIPGIGVCEDEEPSSVTITHRAVGNAYNQIRFSLTRNGENETSIDSVFCPIGEITEYEIEF